MLAERARLPKGTKEVKRANEEERTMFIKRVINPERTRTVERAKLPKGTKEVKRATIRERTIPKERP